MANVKYFYHLISRVGKGPSWRTFQPRIFQSQALTPDLSTPDFSTMNFPTLEFSTSDFSTMNFSTLDFSTPDFSTQDLQVHGWKVWGWKVPFCFGVEKFMVEKSGVERSGVEAWGWKVRGWNVLQPVTCVLVHDSTLVWGFCITFNSTIPLTQPDINGNDNQPADLPAIHCTQCIKVFYHKGQKYPPFPRILISHVNYNF